MLLFLPNKQTRTLKTNKNPKPLALLSQHLLTRGPRLTSVLENCPLCFINCKKHVTDQHVYSIVQFLFTKQKKKDCICEYGLINACKESGKEPHQTIMVLEVCGRRNSHLFLYTSILYSPWYVTPCFIH